MNKKHSSRKSMTDWDRVDSINEADIDYSDIPKIPPEKFAKSILRKNLMPMKGKEQITIRLDTDVLKWFKGQGKGYQSRINELLRAYMEAHKSQ